MTGAYLATVVQSPPASAQVTCGPGKKPVFDPTTGTIVCRGGNDGDPHPGPPGPPVPEPPEGTQKTEQKKTVCSEQECPRNIWCTGKDQPMKYWERTIVYHHATGWQPVPGAAGQWHFTNTTICEPPVDPRPTAGQVWEALRTIGLPGVEPSIEPPHGKTLVNFATIFYAEAKAQQIPDLQVGQATVQIRATPVSYDWDFGDGSTLTTTTPGHAYPDQDVTHKYGKAGPMKPSVAVWYRVEWKYGNGGWQPFPQMLKARTSPSSALEVVDSVTELGSG